jgi:hypothetical protein
MRLHETYETTYPWTHDRLCKIPLILLLLVVGVLLGPTRVTLQRLILHTHRQRDNEIELGE